MPRRLRTSARLALGLVLSLAMLPSACGSSSQPGAGDPCAGLELPPCPPPCPDEVLGTCGGPCTIEGEVCGNTIGDTRVCSDGRLACTVHPPLDPTGCNQACTPAP